MKDTNSPCSFGMIFLSAFIIPLKKISDKESFHLYQSEQCKGDILITLCLSDMKVYLELFFVTSRSTTSA